MYYTYRVSQKKQGLVFRGHFRPLNGRKSKKARKQTPPKIQFYLLGGVFRLICGLQIWVTSLFDISVQLPSWPAGTATAAVPHQLACLDRLETERTDVKNNSAWLAQSSRSAALGKTGRLSVHIVVCTTTCDPKDLSCAFLTFRIGVNHPLTAIHI